MKTIIVLSFALFIGFGDGGNWLEDLRQHRIDKDQEYKAKDTTPFKKKKDRKKFEHLNYFEPDAAYKVTAKVVRFENSDTLEFATSAGTVKKYLRYATLHFTINNTDVALETFRSIRNMNHPIYSKYLFLPFTDKNSGADCYGGGRYLDILIPEGDKIELDFNYAYNPLCAYSEGWFCPIPPIQNKLPIAVNAGEKSYADH